MDRFLHSPSGFDNEHLYAIEQKEWELNKVYFESFWINVDLVNRKFLKD